MARSRSGTRGRRHSGADVDSQAPELVAHDLAFARVKARADPEAEGVHGLTDGAGAASGRGAQQGSRDGR